MTESRRERIRRRLVALTRDLILIPSIPSLPEDRRRCYEFVRNHLDGIQQVKTHEYEHEGIPSLVALPANGAPPDVLLCGHLDVITHPDIRFYRSELRDGRIVGPGAGDMKGALAILLDLFRTLHEQHPGISLGIAVTADEEVGGECGIGYLVERRGLRCKTAMIPDGGSLSEITVEEKGIIHLRVTCEGRPAHAARPWLGDNPIEHLMAALDRVRAFFLRWWEAEDGEHWHPTGTVTVIRTENDTVNRIPANAEAVLDIRFTRPHTVATMLSGVREALGPGMVAEPIITAEPTHLSPDEGYLRATEEVTGQATRLVRDAGGSDARFFARHGIPVLMSRPLVGQLHASDEWIDIESMLRFHRICELYLTRRFGLPPEAE